MYPPSVQLPSEAQQMMQGRNAGQELANQYLGQMPSANDPGGSPPPSSAADPFAPEFDQVTRICNAVAEQLMRVGDRKSAHDAFEIAKKAQGIILSRRNEIAQQLNR